MCGRARYLSRALGAACTRDADCREIDKLPVVDKVCAGTHIRNN